jgi:hypothetical protein
MVPTLLSFLNKLQVFFLLCFLHPSLSVNFTKSSQQYPYHSLKAGLPWNFLYQPYWSMTFNLSLPQSLRTQTKCRQVLCYNVTWMASSPIQIRALVPIWNLMSLPPHCSHSYWLFVLLSSHHNYLL